MPRRKPRKLPVWLQAEESARLLAAAQAALDKAGTQGSRAAHRRNLLLIRTMLFLGLRVSELVDLRIEHVDLGAGQILVYQGKGSKDRMLPLRVDLAEELRAWIGDRPSGPLFPGPGGGRLSVRTVQLMVKRLATKAGLSKAALLTPHKLRHTFASRLVQTGADIVTVRDLMGHASIQTTQVYLHADQSRFRDAIAKL